jgi:hypothetical protein
MIPFAVTIEGLDYAPAFWALAVTEDKLLSADENGALVWYPLADCKLASIVSPDAPKPVIVVQPPSNGVIALPNRAARRRLERDGL